MNEGAVAGRSRSHAKIPDAKRSRPKCRELFLFLWSGAGHHQNRGSGSAFRAAPVLPPLHIDALVVMRAVMLIRSLILVAVAAFLAACAITDSDFAVDTETFLQVSDEGVGGLTKATKYAPSAIRAALPGFEVKSIKTADETQTQQALGVFKDGFQVLQVFRGEAGAISAVHGVTHHMIGPNGERIGLPFGQSGLSRSDCRVGKGLWRGMAICPARGVKAVTLVFSVPEYQGPFDRLPDRQLLRTAELQRLVWQP